MGVCRDLYLRLCYQGFMKDQNGCDLCKCAPPQASTLPSPGGCPPSSGCRMMCEFGFMKDQNGCDLCQCNPPQASTLPAPVPSVCSPVSCMMYCENVSELMHVLCMCIFFTVD